jgi:hypothetical protein
MPKSHLYDDAEDYLEDREPDIERDYDKPYNSLSRKQQRDALLALFFNNDQKYRSAAEAMREGLGRPSGTEISIITLKGHIHHVERNSNGTFKRWID